MSYLIRTFEVTQALPSVSLAVEHTGLFLILRRRDRLVGFILRSLPTPCTIPARDLELWIAEAIGSKILQEDLRDELQLLHPMNDPPTLTVAICTKDRPDNLTRLLVNLVPFQLAEDGVCKFEILVVDNAPSDNRTQALVDTFPTVGYIKEPLAGLNFARNRAINTTTTEWLAFLDDDVTVDRQWFCGWQEAWCENPDAGAITGLVLPYELVTKAQVMFEQRGGFGRGFEKIRFGKQLPGHSLYPCGAGNFGAGCNMAFSRRVLLQLGAFDEALDTGKPLPGGGDLDIFYRVVRAGFPLIYEPQYAVYHQHRLKLTQLQHQYWTWGLGFMAFAAKSMNTDPALRPLFIRTISWWFKDRLRQFASSLVGNSQLSPGMVFAEIWGGVVGLFGEYGRSQRRVESIRRMHH